MKPTARFLRAHALPALVVGAALALPVTAQSDFELLLQQQAHYWFRVSSVVDELEAADDFDLVADIHRIRAAGKSAHGSAPGDVQSVRVAFYAWTSDGPGALQQEFLLPDGDPGLTYESGPGTITVTLPQPFHATGKHFVSVQVDVDGEWGWWCSNFGAPTGATVYSRTDPGGPWSQHVIAYPAGPAMADLAFDLYGDDGTPPTSGSDPSGPWSVVPTVQPVDGASVFLRDVGGVAPDDVWAVGGYTKIHATGTDHLSFIQHWDGTQWSFVPSPNPEPYPHGGALELFAVEAIASDDVWAAGSYEVVYSGVQSFLVHWDGTSWTHVPHPSSPTPSGPFVNDILAFGTDDVWFFGQWMGSAGGLGERRSLAMHWDGSSFEITETPFFDNYPGYGGGHSIEAASATGPDDIWAVGGAHAADFTQHSYIIHWDGESWTHVPGPTPGINNRLYAVAAIAPDDVWASGAYRIEGTGAVHSLFLHWDGSSWTQIDAPPESGGAALLYRPDSGDLITSGGIYGGEGIFRWDGVSWSRVMEFSTQANPSVVALALVPGTDGEVWGVGRTNGPPVGGLTVHLDPPDDLAKIQVLEPCTADAPAESLIASPGPTLGTHVSIAADDPTGAATVAPGSLAVLALGNSLPGGCGIVVGGFGPGGAPGEALLADASHLVALGTWGGPDAPAVFDVVIPSQPILVGFEFAAQAALVDASDADVVLTRGLLLSIGQ